MVLHDVSIYGKKGFHHIWIRDGKIHAITQNRSDLHRAAGPRIETRGSILIPGFINSHDHLDFNLYPQLGNRIYDDYTQWGPAILEEHQELVKQVRAIPHGLRIAWGQYRNLLNGFTTVVNHGRRLPVSNDIVTVYQGSQSLHSAAFEKKWKWKLNNPLRLRQPVTMHAGEGTSDLAAGEVTELLRSNWLRRKIIPVHAVAMKSEQAVHFWGLVWCPASNYFLLGKTADIRGMMENTNIVFGTDSTLTGAWNVWTHFRQAKSHVTDDELLDMLTNKPASLWKMHDRGSVEVGKTADLLLLDRNKNIFDHDPSDLLAVIRNGSFALADESFFGNDECIKNAALVQVGNRMKKVKGDLPALSSAISRYFTFDNPLVHA